jgi:hypothetical protein
VRAAAANPSELAELLEEFGDELGDDQQAPRS